MNLSQLFTQPVSLGIDFCCCRITACVYQIKQDDTLQPYSLSCCFNVAQILTHPVWPSHIYSVVTFFSALNWSCRSFISNTLKPNPLCFLWLHHTIKLKLSLCILVNFIQISSELSIKYLASLETLGSLLEMKIQFCEFELCLSAQLCNDLLILYRLKIDDWYEQVP